MVIKIDLETGTVEEQTATGVRTLAIGSPEAFRLISKAWLRSGWDSKYVYSFTWLGRPMIQLPEDMLRIQEVVYAVKPDVLIETGVAHGGSLVFYASLFKAMGKGRVVGVDVEIRPHNRTAIEAHELSPAITLIEGSSVAPDTVAHVKDQLHPQETVLVVLDSNHTKAHVLAELRAYSAFVTPGSYIVATDGIMRDLAGAPRSQPDWDWNNPAEAAAEFLRESAEFELVEPRLLFNEGAITERVTYWPACYLRRMR
jgi:cephalosporin hydroxylase